MLQILFLCKYVLPVCYMCVHVCMNICPHLGYVSMCILYHIHYFTFFFCFLCLSLSVSKVHSFDFAMLYFPLTWLILLNFTPLSSLYFLVLFPTPFTLSGMDGWMEEGGSGTY